MSYSDMGAIASALASALLGVDGVAARTGALAIADVFPAGGLDDYSNDASSDVEYAFEEMTVDDKAIAAAVNAAITDIQGPYATLKADPAASAARLNLHITGTLGDFQHALSSPNADIPAAFAYLLMTSTMILMMMQEQAITDPAHADDPANSPCAAGLKQYAAHCVERYTYFWTGTQNAYQRLIQAGEADLTIPQLDAALGNVGAILAEWQAVAASPAPFPPLARILSATCETTNERRPGSDLMDITGSVTWSTANTISVRLGGLSLGPSGSQLFVAVENGVGIVSGNPPPDTITAIDRYGRSISQLITQVYPSP